MRHAALIWAGACAAFLPLAAAAQADGAAAVDPAPAAAVPAPAARPAPVPRYNWMQLDFVNSYSTFGLDAGDARITSEAGYRLTGSLLLARPFYFTGSFGNQAYSFRVPGAGKFEIDDTEWSAGVGVFFPLTPSVHLTGAASYEGGRFDTGDFEADANGFGLALGLRAQMTPSVETALAYKYRDQSLEDDADDEADRTGHTFSAGLVGNLTRGIALVLGMERTLFTDDYDAGGEIDSNVENYSIGLRFRL